MREAEILDPASADFRDNFNRRAFSFTHSIATDPRFTIEHLADVTERLVSAGESDRFFAVDATSAETTSKYAHMRRTDSAAHTIRNITRSGAWVKIQGLNERERDYAELLEDILAAVEAASGTPLRTTITYSRMTIFVSGPGVITPYHIDHESNFLFQIRGEKDVCVYDSGDRTILSDAELEAFYSGNSEAPTLRDSAREKGTFFHLSPGTGVHHPPLAPHWVKNNDNVSVSVAIAFALPELESNAKVYQVNSVLRRLGVRPLPPGRSQRADAAKRKLLESLSKRNPENYDEQLLSGYRRLVSPYIWAKRMMRR